MRSVVGLLTFSARRYAYKSDTILVDDAQSAAFCRVESEPGTADDACVRSVPFGFGTAPKP